MDAKLILEQLLAASQTAKEKGLDFAEENLGLPESGEKRDAMLDRLGKGALAAGAVAVLLGTKSGRTLTGTALKVGGVAAVGGLAYKAFNNWQAQQNITLQDTGTPIAELSEPDANVRSEAIVKAMISAAKSDGHIDANEQKLITSKIESLGLEQDITAFLMTELNKPLDVADVVALADTKETAAEIYLASAMVVDLNQTEERQYMDSLAAGLELDPALASELEAALT